MAFFKSQLFIYLCIISQTVSQPIVTVEQGDILGKTVHFQDDFVGMSKDVDIFEGVPYAEPPTGLNRLMPPIPKGKWNGLYNATYIRDICPQYNSEAEGFSQSEDCLHLNVYVSNPMPIGAPVMVFIHGGGFDTGFSYYFNGIPLAAVGDVIMVTIAYRIGPFGFLTTGSYGPSFILINDNSYLPVMFVMLIVTGDEHFSGNYGMLDQVEALRWIKTNVRAFGGDENSITIFGESAGASSVSAHLFSKLSRNLFDRAILESGSIFSPWAFHEDLDPQREVAFHLGAELGCSVIDSVELLQCLREADAIDIQQKAASLGFDGRVYVDGVFLTEHPYTMLMNSDFKKCPIIHGANKDEGALYVFVYTDGLSYNSTESPFISAEEFDNALRTRVSGYKNDLIIDSFKTQYVDWSNADDAHADYYNAYNNILSDDKFRCPSSLELRAHASAAAFDVYQYFFTHHPSKSNLFWFEDTWPKWMGATHTEELQFVFGFPFDPPFYFEGYTYPQEEKQLAYNVLKYWTNFAKTGNPNQESSTPPPYSDHRSWPAFTIPELQYKELAVNLTSGRALQVDVCHFWNNYLPKLRTFSADLVETERTWREEFYTWKYTDMTDWRNAFDEYNELVNGFKPT
ncbi:cholinesterase-like [Amphiura filiformis]|uniref:cholinesterase-like n=1 Tax=Amphiura filiformis TaxID=82378 RepID=UPI003B21C05F